MTLEEAMNKGVALVLEGKSGPRLMVAVLEVKGGLVFADQGWPENDSGHPFHFLPGAINGKNPWTVGAETIRELRDGEPLVRDWLNWQDYLKANRAITHAFTRTCLAKFAAEMKLERILATCAEGSP